MSLENMKSYHSSLQQALDDEFLRKTLDKFAVQFKANRQTIFADVNEKELIAEIAEAKDESLDHLDELYEQFCQHAAKKGIIVHRAATAKDACDLVCQIANENKVKTVIKSKSMTAEEIHINHALEKNGQEVCETDLGEWIIQLRHEGPSHMVMPAIHLSRYQVADTFTDETNEKQDSDISLLVKVARRQLRSKFAEADMGISGANFAVAENGTIAICTNEGNGRLTTTLPRVHVAICGIDKLVPSLHDALRVIKVLPRNATAQAITTYVSWITGAVDCQADVPERRKIFHIVFLDNGRSQIVKDRKCRESLRCVRCGACANVCPVYRLVGGHQMGYVYIGAIGLILTYFFHGHDRARVLAENCIGCEACKDVCAAGIDLPAIIQEIRARLNEEFGSPMVPALMGRVLASRKLFHTLLKFAKFAQKPVQSGQYIRHLPDIFIHGQGFRALPAIADKAFRDIWPAIKPQEKPGGVKVGLFAGCAQDFLYPGHLTAAVKVLSKLGADIKFPDDQSCCGLPVQMMGQRKYAMETAKANVLAFKNAGVDHIVTLCGSCASHMKNRYPDILADQNMDDDVKAFSDKIIDFSSFLVDVLKVKPEAFKNGGEKVGYHYPCHLVRGLSVVQEPKVLLKAAGDYQQSPEEDVCCGFGGTYSLKFPEISATLLENKLNNVEATGATYLVTDCPGCYMQLNGGEQKRGGKLKVEHMAEFLARHMID
ncbi:MAG: LUD domain-containing protein [Deltaproteobacteria bacterium]|jgi:iron-sulfur cluster protein|nr:LUD domain-containing protein [Deltaproteobacteria bacterium]